MLVSKNVKYGVLRRCGCDNSCPLEHRARRNLLQGSNARRRAREVAGACESPREHTALDQYAYYKRYANYCVLTALSREVSVLRLL